MEVAMIRWTDLIGVAGFVLVIASFVLFSPASSPSNEWTYWLGVFAVWVLGFFAIVGWVLTRWSVRRSKDNQAPPLIWARRQR
jgi:Kef-type K+ transport system membrane component KefB